MRTTTAAESIGLDGVMQALGRPAEDPRHGFEHGGRAAHYGHDVREGR